jgi:hypothetical protein
MSLPARLLKPTPTGFDLRRLSGLVQWYDASDQATMTLNGSTVSEWRSKVGGVAVSQATAAAQPTLTQSYYRGRSALTFDGGDFLANLSLPIQRNGMSIGVVFDETTRGDYAGVVVGSPSSGDDFGATPGNGFRMSVHEGTNRPIELLAPVSNSIDLRSPLVSEASALGKSVALATLSPSVGGFGSGFMRFNGTAGVEDSLYNAPSATAGTVIGARYLGGSVYNLYRFTGRILEVAIWSRGLTVSECRTFERYANGKWGTSAV